MPGVSLVPGRCPARAGQRGGPYKTVQMLKGLRVLRLLSPVSFDFPFQKQGRGLRSLGCRLLNHLGAVAEGWARAAPQSWMIRVVLKAEFGSATFRGRDGGIRSGVFGRPAMYRAAALRAGQEAQRRGQSRISVLIPWAHRCFPYRLEGDFFGKFC